MNEFVAASKVVIHSVSQSMCVYFKYQTNQKIEKEFKIIKYTTHKIYTLYEPTKEQTNGRTDGQTDLQTHYTHKWYVIDGWMELEELRRIELFWPLRHVLELLNIFLNKNSF